MTDLIQRARDVVGRLSGIASAIVHCRTIPLDALADDATEAAAIIAELIERVEGVERPKLHPPIYHDGDNFDEAARFLYGRAMVLGKQEGEA